MLVRAWSPAEAADLKFVVSSNHAVVDFFPQHPKNKREKKLISECVAKKEGKIPK